MGWKWSGALDGFMSGVRTGNPYVAAGTTVLGGFSRDIDKGLTGDSQSGMTQGLMDLGTGALDPSQAFSLFQQQRNPADQSDPMYNPYEHAGLIKSRYPFIPETAFQNWLRDNQPQGSIQMGGALRL